MSTAPGPVTTFHPSLPETVPDFVVGDDPVLRGQLDGLLDVDELVARVEHLADVVVAPLDVVSDL